MLSFECIKNEKSVYFLLTSAFSLSHTHYSGLLWVSHLLFFSHTHIGARNKTS